MTNNPDCVLYPVKVFSRTGRLKREVNVRSLLKHHWNEFDKETKESSSITTNSKRLRIRARIKREIDLLYFNE